MIRTRWSSSAVDQSRLSCFSSSCQVKTIFSFTSGSFKVQTHERSECFSHDCYWCWYFRVLLKYVFLKWGSVSCLHIVQCFVWTVITEDSYYWSLCCCWTSEHAPFSSITNRSNWYFISGESVDFYLWLVHCFIPKVSKNTRYMPITESALKYKNNMINKSFKFCKIPLKWLQVSVFLLTQLWYLNTL